MQSGMSTINNSNSWKVLLQKVWHLSKIEAIYINKNRNLLHYLKNYNQIEDDNKEPTLSDLPRGMRKKVEALAKNKFPNDPKAFEKVILESKDLWLTKERMNGFLKDSVNRTQPTIKILTLDAKILLSHRFEKSTALVSSQIEIFNSFGMTFDESLLKSDYSDQQNLIEKCIETAIKNYDAELQNTDSSSV